MKKLRVLVLMHQEVIPPENFTKLDKDERASYQTEYDVLSALKKLGHEIHPLGLNDELAPLRNALKTWNPDIAFNLLEDFHGERLFDQNVVSYLELMKVPYTGCNPRGLIIARDKALSKKILHYHRIGAPKFVTFKRGRKALRPAKMQFPLIVKSLIEESSTGISEASVVKEEEKLAERVHFIHDRIGTDAIVEEYIDGRELYASVLGNGRLNVCPTWELLIKNPRPDAPYIATSAVKWDLAYQKRRGVKIRFAEDLDDHVRDHIHRTARRIYRALSLSGYARIDFRLRPDNTLFFIEANPNPDIGAEEEFASAAKKGGLEFPKLMQKILNLGLRTGG